MQQLFLNESDHNVQALTRTRVAEIDSAALRTLALTRPAIGTALWTDALIGAAIFREWIVNVGRRDAHRRVGHLLCEFAIRLGSADGTAGRAYELPMTQEQLGDAVGLTPVHVNRVLRSLAQRDLISRDRRHIAIRDWDALRDASDFNPRYLHLNNIVP
uniref:Crp/Fnr family transcriptional regulator n=1 Tax=uncultured Sphingomonas sp. TaxID=158754 RepID=UPI0035CB6A68